MAYTREEQKKNKKKKNEEKKMNIQIDKTLQLLHIYTNEWEWPNEMKNSFFIVKSVVSDKLYLLLLFFFLFLFVSHAKSPSLSERGHGYTTIVYFI